MTDAINSARQNESAADYAQSQNCFYPHKDDPFCFNGQIKHLQETILQRDELIETPDLVTEPLPPTQINLDFMDEPGPPDSPSPDFVDSIPFTLADSLDTPKQLLLPLETMDLGYDLKKDIRQYLNSISSKSSCNLLSEWFPMSPVDIDKDEGLLFPSTASRWQRLALRELDREKIEVSYEAQKLLQGLDRLQTTYSHSTLEPEDFGLHQLERVRICPISPPMSPPSDVDGPFIPSPRVTIIDLTSEPSSPPNPAVRKLQQDVQNGTLDSEPISPPARSSSPLQDSLQYLMPPQLKSSVLKIDVPLAVSSPNGNPNWDSDFRATDLVIDKPVKSELGQNEPAGFFDEAMEAILESCHHHTTQKVESEQLNATHSLLRMDISSLSYEIPKPEWHNHLMNSEAQFRWMKVKLGLAFTLKPASISARLCAELKWSPIPHGSGRVSLKEVLNSPGPETRQHLALETPRVCSDDYITCPKKPSILHIACDEEIEVDTPSNCDDMYPAQAEVVASDNNSSILSEKGPSVDFLNSRFFDASNKGKRKSAYNSDSSLLLSNDSTATAKFLSNFLELQCKKKTKTSNETPRNETPRNESTPNHKTSAYSSPQQPSCANLPDAPVPKVIIPSTPYRLIVSTSLNRAIVSQIEKEWPQLELVDKDFSQYNKMTRYPGPASSERRASLLSFESDISVSPATGIILTSLIKVKQKSLPGSNLLITPLCQRVQHVSEKYESLFILVSTANPMGEYLSDLSKSDRADYSKFVQFTTALRRNITVELVHGAEKTLCKWALSIMVPSVESAPSIGNVVTSKDTSWGILLRRAGMNIFASQVLEMLLAAEYGASGMDQFLAMSPETRASKYGQTLGGNRVLMHDFNDISRELF